MQVCPGGLLIVERSSDVQCHSQGHSLFKTVIKCSLIPDPMLTTFAFHSSPPPPPPLRPVARPTDHDHITHFTRARPNQHSVQGAEQGNWRKILSLFSAKDAGLEGSSRRPPGGRGQRPGGAWRGADGQGADFTRPPTWCVWLGAEKGAKRGARGSRRGRSYATLSFLFHLIRTSRHIMSRGADSVSGYGWASGGWTSILSIRHCIHCGASATKTPVITGVRVWM